MYLGTIINPPGTVQAGTSKYLRYLRYRRYQYKYYGTNLLLQYQPPVRHGTGAAAVP